MTNNTLALEQKTSDTSQKLTFFFCIGSQKSGTTILAKMLDKHPDIACIWESYGLTPHSPSSIMNPESDAWVKHGFDSQNILDLNQIWNNKPHLVQRIINKITTKINGYDPLLMRKFRFTMSSALTDFAQRCEAQVVGDKWPWYIDHIELVLKAFPEAKFIYNVRDPRGIWNSAQKFKARERGDEILNEMLNKDRKITSYLNRDNFITIRYEDLISQPQKTCQKIYNFLGIDNSKLSSIDNQNYQDPYPQRWDWIPETSQKLDPWHTHKWQKQMSYEDIERVNEIASWFIDKYQY